MEIVANSLSYRALERELKKLNVSTLLTACIAELSNRIFPLLCIKSTLVILPDGRNIQP
jgi:hypothetical protein